MTLRRLLAKQKRVFRRENRRALEGPSQRELRMTEEQRQKFFKPRHKRSRDALEVQVSRTLVALADVEVERGRPHVALYLRKRSLATHCSARTALTKGKRLGLDKQLAPRNLQLLGSNAMAAAFTGSPPELREQRENAEILRTGCLRRQSSCQITKRITADAARRPVAPARRRRAVVVAAE